MVYSIWSCFTRYILYKHTGFNCVLASRLLRRECRCLVFPYKYSKTVGREKLQPNTSSGSRVTARHKVTLTVENSARVTHETHRHNDVSTLSLQLLLATFSFTRKKIFSESGQTHVGRLIRVRYFREILTKIGIYQ